MLGSTQARLWTPPLRELTPDTSYGFDVIDFARDVLHAPLDPWQEWLVIHAGELLPGGKPRFRYVLAIVARQNGKTHLLKVLTLYWLFVEEQKLILATSTSRDYAKESWRSAVEMAQESPLLAAEIPRYGVRGQIGEECLSTVAGCRYKIAASNRKGGRSLSVDRLVLDELREHQNFEAWDASTKAVNARPFGQIWAISNQGDDESVVLDAMRNPAMAFITTGKGDRRLGLFEWSAPPGADVDDPQALAAANPNLGRRIDLDSLLGDAVRARAAGGVELTGFRTEVLCQKVDLLDPAIEPAHWAACADAEPLDLADYRDRLALCLDVSPDGSHATLVAAAMVDGLARVEVVQSWSNTHEMRAQLPDLVRKVAPRVIGWFPTGPAASIAAQMSARRGTTPWPPRGVAIEELRSEVASVCMSLAELVRSHELRHPADPMLDAQVTAAQRGRRGDTWIFVRDTAVPIDAVYATAGAVHLARTLPAPRARLVVFS